MALRCVSYFIFFVLIILTCDAQVDTAFIYNASAPFGVLDLRIAKGTDHYYYIKEGETFSFRRSNGAPTRKYLDMTAWDSEGYDQGHLREKNGSNDTFVMNYRLLKPQGYDENYAEGYPLVILLHGLLERGNCAEGKCYHGGRTYSPVINSPKAPEAADSELLNNDYNLVHGGSNYLEAHTLSGGRLPNDPNLPARAFPGFVLVPQNLNGWDDLAVEDAIRIVRLLLKKYNINDDRVYLNGVSHGGHGAYKAMTRAPWLFAAAALFSAADDGGVIAQNLTDRISAIPLWLFQGGKDLKPTQSQTERYVQLFRNKGASVRYTLYPSLGHGTWNKAFAEPDFFNWMLRHSRGDVHVYADNPIICLTSNEGTSLTMREGFVAYEWQHNEIAIGNQSKLLAKVPGNYRGRYRKRYNDGDAWSEWSDPVVVTVKDPGTSTVQLTGTRFLPDLNGSDSILLRSEQKYDIYTWYKENNNRLKFDDSVRTITIDKAFGDGKYYIKASGFDKCATSASSPNHIYFADRAPVSVKSPSALTLTVLSPSQVDVVWIDNANNETGFEVWRRRKISEANFEPWRLATIAPSNANRLSDINLIPSSTYEYKIRAINDTGRSLYFPAGNETSSVVTGTDTEIPTAPSLLEVSQQGLNSLLVKWSRSRDNASVSHYIVLQNGEPLKATPADTTMLISPIEVNTTYAYKIVAVDAGGNRSEASNEITLNTSVDGLFYQHTTGAWETLESIDWTLAEYTGTVPRLTLALKTQQDFFNFRFQGYLRIRKDGIYQFRISSDDGSRLAIGDSLVVVNDGVHTMTTTTSPIHLMTSGPHKIDVQFFDYDRSDSLLVEYKGPDSNNEWISIPEEAFTSNLITSSEPISNGDSDIFVFPNPTTADNINVSFGRTTSHTHILIRNAAGQTIGSVDVLPDELRQGYRLREDYGLVPGIYFVTIRQLDFTKNLKLVIK